MMVALYSVFIIEMAVILMNLMIGLAISNIQVNPLQLNIPIICWKCGSCSGLSQASLSYVSLQLAVNA